MDEARLHAREGRLDVLGPVAEVERDLVVRAGAARPEVRGHVVGATSELVPADHPLPVQEGRASRGDGLGHGVEDVTEVPAHGRPLERLAFAVNETRDPGHARALVVL